MTEQCFHLEDLRPTEALEVLATAAEQAEGRDLEKLSLRTSRGVFDSRLPMVAILVPDVDEMLFEAITDAYRQVRNKEQTRRTVPPDALPLEKGIAWLLLNSSSEDDPATEAKHEWLLVAHDINIDRAMDILQDLRFNATHTRIAAAEVEVGPTLYFFHVLDDHRRRSTFLNVVAEDAFPECSILTCFYYQDRPVFLPQGKKPSRKGLDYFGHVLQAAPSLVGAPGARSQRGPLAAIDRWPPMAPQHTLLSLVSPRFHSQADFTPWHAYPADFEVYDLVNSESAVNQLQSAIEAQDPDIGYRLKLRPAKYHEPIEQERRALQEQRWEIEYKLTYLNAIERPRPTLLRFTQSQLPALADVIRGLPGQVIQGGTLKYGFQATDNDAGLHFILIKPQAAATIGLDPLVLWDDLDSRPMRFWLDPYWTDHYYGQGDAWIFVPKGTALSPSLHSWKKESIDQYMHDIIKRWSRDHDTNIEIPEKPIYLFDNGTGTELQISVLDQAQFRPLCTRLGWINDIFTVMNPREIETLVQRMANDEARREIAQEIESKADAVEQAFGEKAQKVAESIAAKVTALTEVVTQELARIVEETEKTIKETRECDERLRNLQAICTEMQDVSAEADKLISQTEKQAKDTEKSIEEFTRTIQETLLKAETARRSLDEQISSQIKEWKQLRDNWRTAIKP